MKAGKLIVFLIALIILAQCKKNEPVTHSPNSNLVFKAPPPLDSCNTVPPSQSFDGYTYTLLHPFCRGACFNPNNGAQFVHIRDNQFYIFDTITKIDRALYTESHAIASTCMQWSSSG
jgi:hypothetical protein